MAQYKYSKWSNVVSYADYLVTAHIARVAQQGGTIDNPALLNLYVQYLVSNNLMSSQYIGAIPSVTGYKEQATTGNAAIVFSVDPAGSTSGAYIGDMSQATLAYQPKLLKYSGQRYLYSSGVNGNYCVSNTTNVITDDIEIILKVSFTTLLKDEWFFSSGNKISILKTSNGKLNFYLNNGGVADVMSSVVVPYSTNTDFYIKCNRKRSTGIANIFLSLDGINWGNGVVYDGTPFATGTGTTGAIYIGTPFTIGGYTTDTYINGKIYSVSISDTIGGAPTVNFDFTNYNPAISETTWTATTGETWTLNRPVAYADSGNLKSTIVTRTKVQQTNSQYFTSSDFSNTDYVSVFNIDTLFDTVDASIYRGLYTNLDTVAVPFNDGYLNNQLLWEGAEFTAGNYGIYSNYTKAQVLQPVNNKKYLGTSVTKAVYPDVNKIQTNKNIIGNGYGGDYSTLFKKLCTSSLHTSGVSRELSGIIVIKGDIITNDAFKDFLNTTIFNGEIY